MKREMKNVRRITCLFGLFALVLLALSPTALADDIPGDPAADGRDFGIGIAVGSPTGLDMKLWGGQRFGVNVGVGASDFQDRFTLHVEPEFALWRSNLGGSAVGSLFIGFGGELHLWDHDHPHDHGADHAHLEAVVPFGFDVAFDIPMAAFIEIRPSVGVLGNPGDVDVGGQIGARYTF